MAQMCYQAGALLGVIFCPPFIDRFGRKKMHTIFTLLTVAIGVAVSFAPNLISFITLRSLIGILSPGCVNSGVAYLMEIFDSRHRTFAGVGQEYWWVFVYLVLAMLAYFIRDWHYLQLTISLCCFIWIIYIWILPETPLWLIARGQEDEAENVLKEMARWNRVRVPRKLLRRRGDAKGLMDKGRQDEDAPKYNVTHLWRDKKLLRHTLIMSVIWFANHNVYYGLTLTSFSLGGDRYLTFVLLGLVELPCYIGSFFVVDRFGRRIPLIISHILAGLPLALSMFVPDKTADGVNLVPLRTCLVLLGKAGITCSFCIIVLLTPELFPTTIRSTGYGFVNILGRVGNMCTPLAAYAAKTIPWLPNMVFGTLSILAGFLAILLPETLNRPLPQTTEDIHKWYQKGAFRKGSMVPVRSPKPRPSMWELEDKQETQT